MLEQQERSAYARLVGAPPSDELHRASLEKLAAKLNAHFHEAEARRAPREDVMRALRQPLIEQAKQNKGHEANVKALRDLADRLKQQRLEHPRGQTTDQRIFTKSIAATRTPPFDWPWTWNATSGAGAAAVAADNNAGTMSSYEYHNNGGSGWGAAALGIYFRPPVQGIGLLNITANPAFSYLWWSYNVFDSSHSDGWLGLYVGAYNPDGTEYAVPVDQQIMLWNESHDFLDSADGNGSNSGYPLNAWIFVNQESFYEIWVWCGGSASGDGDHTFWGSFAGSSLSLSVPFIHWEYF